LEKKKNIRLNCCKFQQRCSMDGPNYKCENIKRSKCWWRGAIRGDVWIQDQNGEWQEVNSIGTFKYLDDIQSGIKVYTQFVKKGKGSVTSSIAISARGKIIKAKNGRIKINRKKLPKTRRPLHIKFIGNHVRTSIRKEGQKNSVMITGLTEDRMDFTYDPNTNTYELTVSSQENSKGLFVDPENPAKYQISENESKSLFHKYIAFSMLRNENGTPEVRKKAMECCHLLNSDSKINQCMSDYIRTKECFVHEFSNHQPDIISKK